MAKINKLQKSGVTIYPATIPQAVIDSETGKTQKELNDDVVALSKLVDDTSVKMTNLVVNGDFRNGTTGWVASSGSTNLVTNGTLTNTGNGSQPEPFAYGNIGNKIVGNKYYLRANVTAKSALCTRIRLGSTEFAQSIESPIVNNPYLLSGVITASTAYSFIVVYHLYASTANANGGAIEVNNVMAINLTTTFGAGNEPTEEEMNLLISTLGTDYFEGEITIPAQKLMQWQLKLIRKNKNAIIALGGTII